MSKSFIDTNIVVYANDAAAGKKQTQALDVIAARMAARTGVISTQVCMEYASVALTKLRQPHAAVEQQIDLLCVMEVVQVDAPLIRAAMHLMPTWSLSFWDAVIVASAQAARCEELLTEGLTHGQLYGTVRAVNPFR